VESANKKKPKLLDRMRCELRARHYSWSTEDSYLHWSKRFILFHKERHPAEMGEQEINRFLTHLATREHVSSSTQNQALSAILFLYRHVLKIEVGDLGEVIWARRPTRLPVVLTKEEVKAVLGNLCGEEWIMCALMYGAGLRLMECLKQVNSSQSTWMILQKASAELIFPALLNASIRKPELNGDGSLLFHRRIVGLTRRPADKEDTMYTKPSSNEQ